MKSARLPPSAGRVRFEVPESSLARIAARMPFKRQNTTSTTSSRKKKNRSPSPIGRKQPSFQKEAKASSSGPKLKQDTYPTYNLRWEALQAFLQDRFPAYDFEERVVCSPSLFSL